MKCLCLFITLLSFTATANTDAAPVQTDNSHLEPPELQIKQLDLDSIVT